MNYQVIDREKYYRKGVFRHFSEDCKCSTSMTAINSRTPLEFLEVVGVSPSYKMTF